MDRKVSVCRGGLLGLAVGDAMGYTVDEKSWREICESYGPNGLLGYDLTDGQAEGSSYTQVAAYVANGLILGIGRTKPEGYPKYLSIALKEWAKKQHLPRDPGKTHCWVSHIPQLRRRRCRDSRMLDALRMDTLGTPERPVNKNSAPGLLPAAAMVGLAYDSRRMDPHMLGILGAKTVALTHGDPETILSGAVLAYSVAGIMQAPEQDLATHFLRAVEVTQLQFRDSFPQVRELAKQLEQVIGRAEPEEDPRQFMEQIGCMRGWECLAGAMFACVQSREDFDSAMILAVNHSGRSAAVGALTGALLGAKLGAEALPEFYLESLEAADALDQLARDLAKGNPTNGLFDDDWDLKYGQGIPAGKFSRE